MHKPLTAIASVQTPVRARADRSMKVTSKSGVAIAAAAATLFLAGMTISTNAQAADGHCIGANACKGQSRSEYEGYFEARRRHRGRRCDTVPGWHDHLDQCTSR